MPPHPLDTTMWYVGHTTFELACYGPVQDDNIND